MNSRIRRFSVVVISLLIIVMSFVSSFPSAQAVTGNQLWTNVTRLNSDTCTSNPAVFTFAGQTVSVGNFVNAQIVQLTSTASVSTVTDNLANTWSVGRAGSGIDIWYSDITVAGTMSSITVTFGSTPSGSCELMATALDSGALTLADTPTLTAQTITTPLTGCGVSGQQNPSCGVSGTATTSSVSFDVGDVIVVFASLRCKNVASNAPSIWRNSICSITTPRGNPVIAIATSLTVNQGGGGGALQSGNTGNTCSSPVDDDVAFNAVNYFGTGTSTNVIFQYSIGDTTCSTASAETYPDAKLTYNVDFIVLHFVQSGRVTITKTTTVTATTGTTTIGDGTISTSASELVKRRLYYDQGQNNINVVATVGNLTGGLYAKVSRVDINTTSATVYLAVYAVTASGKSPTTSDPLVLLYNKAFTVQNGSTNVALDVRPPVTTQVNPYSYYAVAIFTTASKGNTGTLTSSGIVIFTATSPLGTWRDFAVPTNTLPNNFYTGTTSTFTPYAYAVLSYAVGVSTSTTTLTGTSTSTTTVTSTITSTNVINSIDPTKVNNWIMPAFFILFFLGLFSAIGLALKRTTTMFYSRSGKI